MTIWSVLRPEQTKEEVERLSAKMGSRSYLQGSCPSHHVPVVVAAPVSAHTLLLGVPSAAANEAGGSAAANEAGGSAAGPRVLLGRTPRPIPRAYCSDRDLRGARERARQAMPSSSSVTFVRSTGRPHAAAPVPIESRSHLPHRADQPQDRAEPADPTPAASKLIS
jgi:hypothetical protein